MDNKSYTEKLLNDILKDPSNIQNYLDLSNVYISQNDYKNALDVYKQLLNIDPLNVEALINAGSLCYFFA